MGPTAKRILGAALLLCAMLAVGAGGACLWLRARMAAALPRLDGAVRLAGLGAPVRVLRDALGVPTVAGSDRTDVARASGWVHAQDRFFQMDLLRRRGAGELAELFGRAALPLDRQARMHGFRSLAREALQRAAPGQRALIEAYATGVNAGLAALGAPPWEYAILRMQPRSWAPEDTFLITYAMTLDLQNSTGRYIRTLAAIRNELGPASLAFFAPLEAPADAALDGSAAPLPPPPPPSEVDLRGAGAGMHASLAAPFREDPGTPGSNTLAVGGALAAGGSALVASDMHLSLDVPNIWYRMRLQWPGHDETGVTLPGSPALIAGSTGRIAWGFSNSNAGTGDVIVVETTSSPDLYRGAKEGELVPFQRRTETVAVRGSKPETMEFTWTLWGPIVAAGPNARLLAFRWTEDDPAATNLGILDLEEAPDAAAAVEIAHRMGIPAQNFLVADSAGRIAWTIAGLLPARVGYDGRLPVTMVFGDRRWAGFVASRDMPTIAPPPDGRLWTANNRLVGGPALSTLGDGGYDIAARAAQIRDDLGALVGRRRPVEPRDLLAIELDDRAVMMERWHALLLETLRPDAVARQRGRDALLEGAGRWDGRADTGSVGYRLARAFRLAVAQRVFEPVFAPCAESDPDFDWQRLNYEAPLEAILKARPAHLLGPAYASWDDLLLAAADDVSRALAREGTDPREAAWGPHNRARIQHPFARFLPAWAAGWISMPADPLPGDSHMPRVQSPTHGASERFVVAPGRESEGIFHMPGGQCANPMSPYFRAGHEAWVRGDPTPFLPGPTMHALELGP
jgi:penicillin G amidase